MIDAPFELAGGYQIVTIEIKGSHYPKGFVTVTRAKRKKGINPISSRNNLMPFGKYLGAH